MTDTEDPASGDASDAARLIEQGLAHHRAGRLAEAEALYEAVLRRDAGNAEALNHLGMIAGARGDFAAAARLFERAASLDPDAAKIRFNLGECHRRLGDVARALAAYAQAIERDPGMHDAYRRGALAAAAEAARAEAAGEAATAGHARGRAANYLAALGHRLDQEGDTVEAEAAYREAIGFDPGHGDALLNLGAILQQLGRPAEALDLLDRLVALAPDMAEAECNRGVVLQALGRAEAAIAAFRRALALRPDYPVALIQLVRQRRVICDWDGIEREEALVLEAVRRDARMPPWPLLLIADDPASQLRSARRWSEDLAVPEARRCVHPPAQPRDVLRIGYLSPDFRVHPVAFLIAELFERHDRARVSVHGYAIGVDDGSALRRRIAGAFDRFTDLAALSDETAARRIQADGIDILVDLAGHTEGARGRILALRPAPIQVSYLGYPGTMGADFIDYLIADPVTVPARLRRWFSERIAYLPGSYQVNDTRRPIAEPGPSRRDCALPEQGFVFCCFNAPQKITPGIFAIWMRLLAAVPGSVLWLLAPGEATTGNLRREATARGVDPGRLVFAPFLSNPEHLARLRCADLFLDTLPYNGHTSGSDALWAGLPVLTCTGATFASRVAGSLLQAVELGELVTFSAREYEALALALAHDPRRLAALRRRLERERDAAPLFDTAAQARLIEAAYAEMWRRHAAGAEPGSFALTPSGAVQPPA